MRIKFVLKESVRKVKSFETEEDVGFATIKGNHHLHLDLGRLTYDGPDSYLEARDFEMPVVLREHLDYVLLENEILPMHRMSQGLYATRDGSPRAECELMRLPLETPIDDAYGRALYRVVIRAAGLPLALETYSQLLSGKCRDLETVAYWEASA